MRLLHATRSVRRGWQLHARKGRRRCCHRRTHRADCQAKVLLVVGCARPTRLGLQISMSSALPWTPAGDDYDVKDQTGAIRFKVNGKVMTMRDKMVICNEEGEKVAMVQRKLLSLKSTFQVRSLHVGSCLKVQPSLRPTVTGSSPHAPFAGFIGLHVQAQPGGPGEHRRRLGHAGVPLCDGRAATVDDDARVLLEALQGQRRSDDRPVGEGADVRGR